MAALVLLAKTPVALRLCVLYAMVSVENPDCDARITAEVSASTTRQCHRRPYTPPTNSHRKRRSALRRTLTSHLSRIVVFSLQTLRNALWQCVCRLELNKPALTVFARVAAHFSRHQRSRSDVVAEPASSVSHACAAVLWKRRNAGLEPCVERMDRSAAQCNRKCCAVLSGTAVQSDRETACCHCYSSVSARLYQRGRVLGFARAETLLT